MGVIKLQLLFRAKEIIHNIEQVRKHNESIFISTNAKADDPILVEVMAQYTGYLLDIPLGSDYHAPIISAHLLAESKIFIGNLYSTYTNVVSMRRCYKNSHYFQVEVLSMITR